jgi:hypothetical protein
MKTSRQHGHTGLHDGRIRPCTRANRAGAAGRAVLPSPTRRPAAVIASCKRAACSSAKRERLPAADSIPVASATDAPDEGPAS